MNALATFARILSDSLSRAKPRTEGGWYLASWRMLAMALWEYRRGNDAACLDWLEKSSQSPNQATSCLAGVHLFWSMAAHNLGKTNEAQSELKLGKEMVAEFLNNKLELGNTKSGRLGGWIMNPIFLREAERMIAPLKTNAKATAEQIQSQQLPN